MERKAVSSGTPAPRAPPGRAAADVTPAIERALGNLTRRQDADGSWAGDYGGPMFLLPMYLALCHAAGEVPVTRRAGMVTYFTSVQHPDGSVGLHAEDPRGSMFTTALSYVALRVLGLPADDERAARMRGWILANGTPLTAAAWGKFTLCLLGLYDWRGLHPILPELWLLPRAAPFHPRRLWCHARQVYLPMAWLYGKQATVSPDALIVSLREELYGGRFAHIAWEETRDAVAGADAYRPPSQALGLANKALALVQRVGTGAIREKALAAIFEHIVYEDRVTDFVDIGPVNKVLNAFVHWFVDPSGEYFRRAFAACDQYLWEGHDGVKLQGYNSSRLWDTAFAVQAALAGGAAVESPLLQRAYGYLRDNQILEDVPEAERYFRHRSRGGWPFSNRAHGWPITDCTAEGLKCALALSDRTSLASQVAIPTALLEESVRLILSWQNDDGGWATYEKQRGGAWLEALNPSQVFGNIMVDYSYVECTSACLQALVVARARFGLELAAAIDVAMARGLAFLRKCQLADGSFEGSWGVCFTYGTWFGVSGLLAGGATYAAGAIQRACGFLLDKQRADGSWGEHGDSCRERRYVQAPSGLVAQTAWALLTLTLARHPDAAAQARAATFLIERQEPDGGWAREPMVGVFNRTCLINYDNYRHYFPLWALAQWRTAQQKLHQPERCHAAIQGGASSALPLGGGVNATVVASLAPLSARGGD